MGGRRRDDNSKADFIARARQERRLRELERARQHAASFAQRWWRGRHSAACTRRRVRSEWDSQMGRLVQITSAFALKGLTFEPPAATITAFTKKLVFFNRVRVDGARVTALASILHKSCRAKDPKNNYLSAATSVDDIEVGSWCLWTGRFLALILEHLAACAVEAQSPASPSPSSSASASSSSASSSPSAAPSAPAAPDRTPVDPDVLCAAAEAIARAEDSAAAAGGGLRSALQRVLLRQAAGGPLLDDLRACWSISSPLAALSAMPVHRITSLMLELVLKALGFENVASSGDLRMPETEETELVRTAVREALHRLALRFLTLPTHSLTAHPLYGSLCAALAGREARGWWLLVDAACEHMLRAADRAVSASALVWNILALQAGQLSAQELAPDRAASLVHLIHAHVTTMPPLAVLDGPANAGDAGLAVEEAEDEDDDMIVHGSIGNGVKGLELLVARELRQAAAGAGAGASAGAGAEAEAGADTSLQLASAPMIIQLFEAVLAPHPPPSGQPVANCEAPLLALCAIYGKLLVHSRSALDTMAGRYSGAAASASTILNTLALGRVQGFVARLWAQLQPEVAHYADEATDARAAGLSPTVRMALFLFCATYSHQLLALDDEQFFEKGVPLSLKEQFEATCVLKQLLYQMFWETPVAEQAPFDLESVQLLLSVTRLYNQLYDRHARHEFAHFSREHWHWPAVHSRELADAMTPAEDRGMAAAFGGRRVSLLLTCIPQVLQFKQRVKIFHRLIEDDKATAGIPDGFGNIGGAVHDVTVNRDKIYEDAMRGLPAGPDLKHRIRVTFESELGYQEAGIDGGGLFKDFMDALAERAFDPQYGLFNVTSEQLLYPNPASPALAEDHLAHFAFMGRVLGKAIFDKILVRPAFASFFLNKLLGRINHIDDLYTLDPEVYRNLMSLKDISRSGGDIEDLALSFTATTGGYGSHVQTELVPGGADIPVTNANFFKYIAATANFKLNRETAAQSHAFLRGFHDIINVEWIRMFDARELQMVIGGEARAIDIDNLRAHTRVSGGYHDSQPIMQWFWQVLRELTPQQQGDFLKFVTSSPRQPLLGFEYMQPPICIQKVPLGEDGPSRLPSAATCMNLLKLPDYPTCDILREKLLYAISANAGFEMS